jgi:hypothetical protein
MASAILFAFINPAKPVWKEEIPLSDSVVCGEPT